MHWMMRVEVTELNVYLGDLIESFSRIGMKFAKETDWSSLSESLSSSQSFIHSFVDIGVVNFLL